MNINKIITLIRESFSNSVEVYTKGSCIRFSMILKELFPDGEILYNSDHAIFELYGKCYDITGEVQKTNHIPISEYGEEMCIKLMELKY